MLAGHVGSGTEDRTETGGTEGALPSCTPPPGLHLLLLPQLCLQGWVWPG